ncbi:cytosine permease [uncultured Roseburia sp.]|uniref:Hydroxymethylpyrimidine transporter CytX n=2 Tax=Brotonthovivens ammoniilytica TaxID=2981725 RepID=A0ABT2TM53_9FIRM|nr:putative hydroxymethylpyrimidine transporter CytX [Brotonthovivens ammoniilytica]MCU6763300.1 putative hydroxymethylpyrimidine transporter CytX [Brotonthovivens ammoniilytica]SCJ12509.1 cytosine permease [uncultured Roseburia sp.]
MSSNKKGTSLFANGLIWFGAGVSIAEILTGTYLAPLGFSKGVQAIILGHLIGCILLFLAGVIGGKQRKSAMETVKVSFGKRGGLLFSFLNVLQLVGWTAIMIYDGALAADGIFHTGKWVWCLVIGGLIALWILIGVSNLGKVNLIAMTALFILTLILCRIIFADTSVSSPLGEAMTFGAAVELSVAMPLSWLPVISDYIREAKQPVAASAVSTVVYGIVSCWMYIIGMGIAIFTGESDIASIMVKAGLGVAGLLIIIFSTVTTTFLDAFSAGVSSVSISGKINEKWAALAAVVVGTAGAMIFPMDDITDFLYLIGSVFAPMVAVQIADFFVLKHRCVLRNFDIANLMVWGLGFLLYRYLMTIDLPLGNTLPDMVITALLCVVVGKIRMRNQTVKEKEIGDS